MILLPDDPPEGSGEGGGITHPFVTETYRCVAAYETKDTKNRPFKVAVDEKLDVLIKDPAGRCFSLHADTYWKPARILNYPHTKFCDAESVFHLLSRLVAGRERE